MYYVPLASRYYHIMRPDGRFTFCNLTPSAAHRIVTEPPTNRKRCKQCNKWTREQVTPPAHLEPGDDISPGNRAASRNRALNSERG